MQTNTVLPLQVFVGWDDREAVTADVLTHSILKRTRANVKIQYLKHRELRAKGLFNRPWNVGIDMVDMIDGKPFSTQFSHTRFLVPALMNYKGWALFMDSDMIFLSDIKKLFDLCDDKYAVMCVKHHHKPKHGEMKMDGRQQQSYQKKNWSSFVMFNCGHKSNKDLTPAQVNFMKGGDLHAFSWLHESEIGSLPPTYNFISGVSPPMSKISGSMPDVIHYTNGGPWFSECPDVPYGGKWIEEYEDWQKTGGGISGVPSMKYEEPKQRTGSISISELEELEFTNLYYDEVKDAR